MEVRVLSFSEAGLRLMMNKPTPDSSAGEYHGGTMKIFRELRQVTTFDGMSGRIGEINIVLTRCDVCGSDAKCVYIDGSEGEYSGGAICLDCCMKEIDKPTQAASCL